MNRGTLAIFILLAMALPADAARVQAAPLRVDQPAYGGMQFYVYRPRNMPAGWFMTYDGYAVQRGKDGLWYYGSANGASVAPTRYLVGAVVPSVTGLIPWERVPSAPPTGAMASPTPSYAPPLSIYVPPYGSVQTAVYTPEWVRDPAFAAISRWGKSVDRMGVLTRPKAPVAWKGRRPQVIYVWTGRAWRQVTPRPDGTPPLSALRGRVYELTVDVDRSDAPWTDADSSYLAHYAAQWGYIWMGPLSLIPSEGIYQ